MGAQLKTVSLDYIPEPAGGASSGQAASLEASSRSSSRSGQAASLEVRADVHKTFHDIEDTGEADIDLLDVTQEGKQVTQF